MRLFTTLAAMLAAASVDAFAPRVGVYAPATYGIRRRPTQYDHGRVRGGGGALRAIPAPLVDAFRSSGVQKILELGAIAALGGSLRKSLDPTAMTKLLLQALVPAVIVSSLASLRLSLELGTVALAGLGLLALQFAAGTIAANAIVMVPPEATYNSGAPRGGPVRRRQGIRRTAAVQLATMAPAVSVFSFTREFAGPTFVGLAALADVPTKAYHLLLLPTVARLRGDVVGQKEAANLKAAALEAAGTAKENRLMKLLKSLRDPFNAAIVGGLLLAALQTPTSSLGFLGKG